MADPLTWSGIAALGTMAIQGAGMAAGAQGAHEEGTQNRADAENAGRMARQQNARLSQGSAPMPEYSQDVQGYGMPDASGQYTQIAAPAQPEFTDTPAQTAAGPDPEMVARYQEYLKNFQQPAVQQTPAAPIPMTPVMAVQPMMPTWFDDGPQRGQR